MAQITLIDTNTSMIEWKNKWSNTVTQNDVKIIREHLKMERNDRANGIATRLLQLCDGNIERAKLAVDRFIAGAQSGKENDSIESKITSYIKDIGKHRTNYAAMIEQSVTDGTNTMIPGSILYTEVNYNMPTPTWNSANKS